MNNFEFIDGICYLAMILIFDLFKASCKLIINVESKKVYAIEFIYLFIKYPVSLLNIYIQRALKLIMC